MGFTHHLGAARLLRGAAVLALALPSTAGCAGQDGGHRGHGAGERAGTPASLDQLAARTGCTLTGHRRAQELQQGNCANSRGRYVLVSFTTDRGLTSWMAEAKPWGGSYLVGTRWVAVSTPATLQTLQKDLGGRIMSGDAHSGMPDMPGMNHG
ncbi:hypothetical protein [Actinomadura sp. NEAU-AAG7]|uniref:hypothetical protein n=1 Tax=Actinomadura sp. NEAU-AAG7 TaxID=2839640 RepID=UPI001BE44718|nr:hypothetical protein [Actinomadura sp. NEAU-AAG7]MBT2209859.1 hypothetical protein [Actinomadura sp. NEAU-AAG7]